MRVSINRKTSLLIFVVVVVALGIVFGAYTYFRGTLDDEGRAEVGLEDSVAQIEESVISLQEFSEKRTEELVNTIQEPADLNAIEEDGINKGSVAIAIINSAVDAQDLDKANRFIDEVATYSDGYSLEALVICYRINEEQTRKDTCRSEANRLAIEQGIIEGGETLPDSYFIETEEIG